MALLTRPAALLLVALAAGCFSPHVGDCDIRCSPARACPDDTTCGADGWCHVDVTSVCPGDGGSGKPDAAAAPDGRADAPVTPDAAVAPDAPGAPPPDARPAPDAGPADAP